MEALHSEMDRTKRKCYEIPASISLKNTVYATKPQALEEMTDQIEHAISDIPLTTIQTVSRSVRRRC